MAKRAARQIVKVDDVQRTLELRSPSTSSEKLIIQIPDMLMRSNRRQYQQCRAYDFQMKIGGTNNSTEERYEIYTLSNAWWVKKSIEFAKAVYLHSTKEERAILGTRMGKWNDFIISAEEAVTSQLYSDLYQYSNPTDGTAILTAAEVTADETIFEDQSVSEVEGDQDLGAEQAYGFSIAPTEESGAAKSYNIFDQYMLTRQHVTPADSRASPYESILEMDNVAMDALKTDGDNAPFNLDAFPSPWVLADTLGHDQGIAGGTNKTVRLTAPLGMVIVQKLDKDGSAVDFTTNEKILLMCSKGRYKGVHAPAYKATKLMFESSGVSKFKQ